MTVALRADAEVLNSTAGTSVTVTKPAGTANGDFLVAFVGETGTGSITAPAGWTLIGSQASSTLMTVAAYTKEAASEGASWTWTLGASVRNFGWVGAFTGVDTSDAVIDSTSTGGNHPIENEDIYFHPHGMLVQCGSAIRAATGAQLVVTSELETGTISGRTTEAASYIDIQSTQGTNGGSGTDIAGTVATYSAPWNVDRRGAHWGDRWLAQSDTTARVVWSVSLRPAVVAAFDGGDPDPTIEVALGGDPDDPTTWSWTDVTTDVLHDVGVKISSGRTSQATTARPTSLDLVWLSETGKWHPDNPISTLYPYVRDGLPIRATVPYGYSPTSLRGLAFARVLEPAWDITTSFSVVRTQALGRLEQARRGQALTSPLHRSISGVTVGDIVPHGYWPMEDGSTATSFASAVTGHPPIAVTAGTVSLAADSDLASSKPLPNFPAGALASVNIPAYTATTQWVTQFAMKVPSEPGAESIYAEVRSSGTAAFWRVSIEPGSPATVRLRTYNSAGTLIGGVAFVLDSLSITEADFFDNWAFITVSSADDGGGNYSEYFGIAIADIVTSSSAVVAGSHGSATYVGFSGGLTGASFGHTAVWVDPDFLLGEDDYSNAAAFGGWEDEAHPERFLRLYREEGIPVAVSYLRPTIYDRDAMGVQGLQTLDTLTTEIETIDSGGFVHDSRGPNGEIILDLRADRYNQPVALTLDLEQRHLSPPYTPRLDNQRRRTKTVVTVPDGTSATYANDIGRGMYNDPVSINLGNPDQAVQWAAWRVNLGTQTGLRYPQIAVDLRRTPDLVPDFCALRVGQVIRVTNPPSQQAPSDVDVIVEGIDEYISNDTWRAVLHCSPAKVYEEIGVYGTAALVSRYDGANSTLAAAVDADDTSLLVVTEPDHALWVTGSSAPKFPLNVGCSGIRLPVSAIASPVVDTFTRTESSGWGTPDTSPVSWTVITGPASDITVSSNVGRHSLSAAGAQREVALAVSWADLDVIFSNITFPAVPTGGNAEQILRARYVDGSNFVDARLFRTTANVTTIALRQFLAGVETNLGFPAIAGATATSAVSVRLQAIGSTLRLKAWLAADSQPSNWALTLTATMLAAGAIRVNTNISGSSTNTFPLVATYDNFEVPNPQTFTVTRSADGIDKALSAGGQVRLWSPARYAL